MTNFDQSAMYLMNYHSEGEKTFFYRANKGKTLSEEQDDAVFKRQRHKVQTGWNAKGSTRVAGKNEELLLSWASNNNGSVGRVMV